MNHKQKVKLAKRMAGNKNQTGIFLTNAWEKRKQGIARKVENRIVRI